MKLKGKDRGGVWRPYVATAEWLRHVTLMGGGGGFVRAPRPNEKAIAERSRLKSQESRASGR